MSFSVLSGHIVEFFITFLFLSTVFKLKKKNVSTIISGLLMYTIILMIYLLFESTIVNILSVTIFNFIFGIIFFNCSLKSSFLSSLFLTTTLTVSEFIVMALMSIGNNNDINIYKSSTISILLMLLLSRTIYLILILIVGTSLPKDSIKKTPLFLILFPISATCILYTLWYISASVVVSNNATYLIIAASISIVASVLLTYVFYAKTYKELNILYTNQSEKERIVIESAYYSILDKQNMQLKTVLHNEKNHLSVIKSLANKPEVSKYIDEIYGEIIENSSFGNTQNKILDLIINKYQYICDDNKIDFYVSIKTANLSYIESSDLTTLFGNLLDNAIDAATKSKKRKIDLSLNKVNGLDILTCSNSCNLKPHAIGQDLITTKENTGFHGLGIQSIKRVVKKYHGNFDWKYDDINKEFTIYIAF